eukprot:TRINITY_DN8105_c0_g1_i3.p1 TRINITY_DN8105_c0_g1~~TRINITY_DN8105_c0_g1_i3.p1  ORF type:complete len:103 (-),score=9.85 TRINITY_DN8105_c0_g1_i3:121-429(-)
MCIRDRLYRKHATEVKGRYVKDIQKLGRDNKRVVIVDSIVESFQLQPMNGIYVAPWKGESNDKELLNLLPLLKEIARQQVPDVRTALRNYRDGEVRRVMSNG